VLEWLQQLHQGVRPDGWSMQEVRSLFQSAVTIPRNEGIAPAGIVLDLAEALDAMGATNDGIDLLSSLNDSLNADLMRSKFLARLGKYTQAKSLVLDCMQRSPGSLEVYQWASELFTELGEENRLKWLDQRFLTRTNGMEDFSVYSKNMRRTERFELAEPIGRFLQVQFDSFPSSLADLWLEDVYWIWNLSLLANQYHQSVPDHPERIDRTFDLTLMSSLFDIFSEFDSESGMNLQMARGRTSIGWDMDWTRWAWRYERVLAAGFWQAVSKGGRGPVGSRKIRSTVSRRVVPGLLRADARTTQAIPRGCANRQQFRLACRQVRIRDRSSDGTLEDGNRPLPERHLSRHPGRGPLRPRQGGSRDRNLVAMPQTQPARPSPPSATPTLPRVAIGTQVAIDGLLPQRGAR